MAILGKIRQRSLVLILVIAMALFAFVVGDIFTRGGASFGKSETVVATVNGKDISRDDFNQKVETLQRNLGPSISYTQAMNRVWDQELRKAIMETQYDEAGIRVEREMMRGLIEQNLGAFVEFQDDAGNFDEFKLNEFIANLKAIAPEPAFLGGNPITYDTWTQFERDIASAGLYSTYFNMVKAGITGTLADGKMDHVLENEKVDIRYVQIPYSSIPDSTISVKKSDITEYVNRNIKDFEVEESRDIAYVRFDAAPSLTDEQDTQKALEMTAAKSGFSNLDDIEQFINTNSDIPFNDAFLYRNKMPLNIVDSIFPKKVGESYGPYKQNNYYIISKVVDEKTMPDSVKVRHILIPHVGAQRADASVSKTMEEAKTTADSILNVIKSRRARFTDLLELSSDKVSNEKAGEIEFGFDSSMAPEFKAFSFENEVGEIDVVQTSFGYHIIEILEHKNKQRVIKVASLAEEIEASEKTIDSVYTVTSRFEMAAGSGDFDEIAKENNYTVRPVSEIKVLDENIPGLGPQRPIIRWAFEDETKVGDIRRFPQPDGGFIIVTVTAINKEGVMSNEKASVTALPEIRKEMKAKMIMDRLTKGTLSEIASAEGQSVRTSNGINMKNPTISGAGNEPKVVGTAFGLNEGEISTPIKGKSGVFVIELVKKTPAPDLASYQSIATRLGTTKATQANTGLYNALKEAAEIEDNRAAFY